MKKLRHVLHFLKHNQHKLLSIDAYFLSGWYRLCILCLPMRILEKWLGVRGEESQSEVSQEQYVYAEVISRIANRICNQTRWQSKCLVRAMVAQKLLIRKHISTTLYLGVKKENNQLIAHAWLRTGHFYCTGGDGKDYVMVAKFGK